MHTHSQRDINKKKQDYLHVYTLIEPKGFKRSAPTDRQNFINTIKSIVW